MQPWSIKLYRADTNKTTREDEGREDDGRSDPIGSRPPNPACAVNAGGVLAGTGCLTSRIDRHPDRLGVRQPFSKMDLQIGTRRVRYACLTVERTGWCSWRAESTSSFPPRKRPGSNRAPMVSGLRRDWADHPNRAPDGTARPCPCPCCRLADATVLWYSQYRPTASLSSAPNTQEPASRGWHPSCSPTQPAFFLIGYFIPTRLSSSWRSSTKHAHRTRP